MRPDGLIEVEGEGTPAFEPGSPSFEEMQLAWGSWASLIRGAARRHGVPASWILAIMSEETGLWADRPDEQASKVSPAGAVGLMQIMPATGAMLGAPRESLTDPGTSIDVGAALLRTLADRHGPELPAIAAAYNSGGVCSEGANAWNLRMADDYAGNVIRWQNAAVLYLGTNRSPVLPALALAGAGLYAAAAIAGLVRFPPRILARFA